MCKEAIVLRSEMKRQAQVMCRPPLGEVVAFEAREIDDDLLGLVVLLAVLAGKGALGMEQLVREVSQNGGTAT
jgi:hypothetical protein